MTKGEAETAVTASALIVAGIYSYRKMVESSIPSSKPSRGKLADAAGFGPVPPVGRFLTGFGVTFIVLALTAQFSPDLGGSFAILVAAGDVLGNGTALAQDVNDRLGTGQTAPVPHTAAGVPVFDPTKETAPGYDKRLGDYLLAHPPRVTTRPMVTSVPGVNPLFPANPLTGSPLARPRGQL